MRVAVAVALGLFTASAADAQLRETVNIPLPGPRVIHGFVADSTERPIDSAEVFITSLKRITFTAPDGSFRFEDVKPGRYQVGVRKLGYYPDGRTVQVGDNGGATAFWLVRRADVTLPTIVSSARSGGLSGVIGDTAYRAIAGAKVWVLASDKRAESDSTGAFYMDLKPGRHMVRVERPGYGSKLVSVTIPKDSGRRVMVWLSPASRAAEARDNHMLQEFSMRLTRRRPVWSTVYTREDIARSGKTLLGEIATAGAGRPVDPLCLASVNGDTTRKIPIWVVDAADLETVEVYVPRPPRQAVTSIGGGNSRPASSSMSSRNFCPQVIAWLRK